ncbi:hypothetical protein [Armatimonas rosea]|uniref:Uncharacterized protein n=1 Tax=Armatimonas rosea TaxID=685828 RepID=A0A7W9SMQ8_ARMRO|nr:hypothetical protein [Armatimonas rosea]MBB6049476.1 hypothetical protein [Armatimonas rosea]
MRETPQREYGKVKEGVSQEAAWRQGAARDAPTKSYFLETGNNSRGEFVLITSACPPFHCPSDVMETRSDLLDRVYFCLGAEKQGLRKNTKNWEQLGKSGV